MITTNKKPNKYVAVISSSQKKFCAFEEVAKDVFVFSVLERWGIDVAFKQLRAMTRGENISESQMCSPMLHVDVILRKTWHK